MSVCEKISPFAHGLTESKLQRIGEVFQRELLGEECDLVTCCCLLVERISDAPWPKVTALSEWSGAVSRREHEMATAQSFRRSHKAANVFASVSERGRNTVP